LTANGGFSSASRRKYASEASVSWEAYQDAINEIEQSAWNIRELGSARCINEIFRKNNSVEVRERSGRSERELW
jgi:hypothetical protein